MPDLNAVFTELRSIMATYAVKLDVKKGAFYCFLVGRRVVVLHAFIKKSQQTPDRELDLARRRQKEVRNG